MKRVTTKEFEAAMEIHLNDSLVADQYVEFAREALRSPALLKAVRAIESAHLDRIGRSLFLIFLGMSLRERIDTFDLGDSDKDWGDFWKELSTDS